MKKVNLTALGVLLFVTILIFAFFAEDAKSDPYIGLGRTAFNSELTTGEIGWVFNERYDFKFNLIGEGATKKGRQPKLEIYSVSRIVEPGWGKFFMRIGAAHVENSRLVGKTNYVLGAGFRFERVSLEFLHFSSAGINPTNTGIDVVPLLRLRLN